MRRTPLLFLTTFCLAGCPDGPVPDAGVAPTDAALLDDAGRDAAHPDDAGPDPADAGLDAGPPDAMALPDAGIDAGIDAGPPPPHADPTPAAVAYWSDVPAALTDAALVDFLHDKLAADHNELSFSALFDAYETTDTGRDGCAGVFDFYSDECWNPSEACGQYSQEGDCFNREHSWPKSWWGGGTGPEQHQDLIAVIPADGYVNGVRGNLPLGTVTASTYTSGNGSRRGLCTAPGAPPGAECFEPTDALKGDLARIYFYMAVRYEGELSCCDEPGTDDADLKPWLEDLMRQWHAADTVDEAERERNERIPAFQNNRNPFVDYPDFVDRIADF